MADTMIDVGAVEEDTNLLAAETVEGQVLQDEIDLLRQNSGANSQSGLVGGSKKRRKMTR